MKKGVVSLIAKINLCGLLNAKQKINKIILKYKMNCPFQRLCLRDRQGFYKRKIVRGILLRKLVSPVL